MRALVVSSQPEHLTAVGRALQEAGYQVELEGDPEVAQYHLDMLAPDVVVLDGELPGLAMFSLYGALREDERTAHVPVIFTRYSDADAERDGDDVYLAPDADEDAIVQAVRDALARPPVASLPVIAPVIDDEPSAEHDTPLVTETQIQAQPDALPIADTVQTPVEPEPTVAPEPPSDNPALTPPEPDVTGEPLIVAPDPVDAPTLSDEPKPLEGTPTLAPDLPHPVATPTLSDASDAAPPKVAPAASATPIAPVAVVEPVSPPQPAAPPPPLDEPEPPRASRRLEVIMLLLGLLLLTAGAVVLFIRRDMLPPMTLPPTSVEVTATPVATLAPAGGVNPSPSEAEALGTPAPTAIVTSGVRGRVLDARANLPIIGATVEFINAPVTAAADPVATSDDGRFERAGLPPGNYLVRASATGYRPAEANVGVFSDQLSAINLLLQPE